MIFCVSTITFESLNASRMGADSHVSCSSVPHHSSVLSPFLSHLITDVIVIYLDEFLSEHCVSGIFYVYAFSLVGSLFST